MAGVEEAEQELLEVVDFLRHPEKYRRLGGRIPHGVLLTGPPGTGKTLLARAVAGEADAPFFSMAASEFVEAIVGVGASRVRDLFAKAKAEAPAIVFIDELDAIGRSRTSGIAGFSGGNDEREQTLNQILTEMDGFDSSTGVIVIAATNRPEILDSALLRPGRFDRRVAVQPPDRAGREAILKVHTRGMPLGDDVDLGRIAASTPGMVGADLANLVNEAALTAARREHERITESDFTDSLERIVLGAERQIMMTDADRRRTAYHEARPRARRHAHPGRRPGAEDLDHPARHGARRHLLRARDRPLQLRGARAEGADQGRARRPRGRGGRLRRADDGRRVRHPAADRDRAPDGRRWGMSPAIGPLAVASADGRGPYYPGGSEVSERTQQLIDEEMRRIVDEAHEQVVELLRDEPRQAGRARRGAARARDARRGGRLRRGRRRARRPDEASGRFTAAARTASQPAAE